MRYLVLAFCLAAAVGFAGGRWDGQFVANPAGASILSGSGDQCTPIPGNGAYLKVGCADDAYVGVGKLGADGGIVIGTATGTGGKCTDADGGYACVPYRFSWRNEPIGYIQAASSSNRICVRSMDGGSAACTVGVGQQ